MRHIAILLPILAVSVALQALAQPSASEPKGDAAIRALEHAWDNANLKADASALDAILAPDFIMTGDDGVVHTRQEVLSELKSRNIAYDSAKTEELRIILHGDAAVTSGRWQGSYKNHGKTVNLVERFTNFYVQRDGQWRCVASHGTAIKPRQGQ